MKKILRVLASTLLVCTVLATSVLPMAQAAEKKEQKKVFVVMAPYLTWDDISADTTPKLFKLAEDGAIANINARSRTRDVTEGASPLEGALTISAGSWAVPVFDAAAAYSIDESYEYGTAGEAFERMTGSTLGGSNVVYLGLPVTQRENTKRSAEIYLGSLGQSIEDADGTTVAIGNSDTGYVTGEQRRTRPAALVAMNQSGKVHYGDVSQNLLREDADSPFGIRTDLDVFKEELTEALASGEQDGGPMLVSLDPGDLNRAVKFRPQVADSVGEQQHRAALRTLDSVVEIAQESMGEDDVLMVVSQVSQDANGYEGFGPAIVYGGGYHGYLSASSTHQKGLVVNPDVATTILDVLGIKAPVSMGGNPMFAERGTGTLTEKIDGLSKYNRKAIAVESSKAGTIKTYIVLSVIVFVLATILILRVPKDAPKKMTRYFNAVNILLIAVVAFPLATYLMFVVIPQPQTATMATVGLGVAFGVIMLVSLLLWRFFSSRVSLIFLMLTTAVLLTVEQWVGYPLSVMGYLTYSPLLAARFYGIGNEGAALLFGASIVGFALLLDMMHDGRPKWILTNVVFPLFALVATLTMAAPMLGANVGVVIWGLLGYAVAWFLFSGNKITWKFILGVIVGIAAFLGLFILYDLYGPGEPTHLARALTSANEGGIGQLGIIIARKVQTSLRVITFTNWSFMLIAVFVFLAVMRLRPSGDFAETLAENPALGHALTASFVGGGMAMLSEDSGIIIPALLFIYGGIAIVWAMLCHARRKSGVDANDGLSEKLG